MLRLTIAAFMAAFLLCTDARAEILPHPSGCMHRAFCGCGVSLRVFGKRIARLFLAENWFSFPRARLAAGMVAVRKHHVFYIEKVLGRNKVLAYDPNSGGHLTRRHVRSVSGFRIVNPRAHADI